MSVATKTRSNGKSRRGPTGLSRQQTIDRLAAAGKLSPAAGETPEKLEPHPLALAIPRPGVADRKRLRESIKTKGFDARFPIWLYERKILDGLSRFEELQQANDAINVAQALAGADSRFALFSGSYEEAREFVERANVNRRQLDGEQIRSAVKALRAVRAAVVPRGTKPPTVREIAAREDLPIVTVHRARKVAAAAPELGEAVERGNMGLKEAAQLADRPVEEQRLEAAKPAAQRKAQARANRDADDDGPWYDKGKLQPGDLVNGVYVPAKIEGMRLSEQERLWISTVIRYADKPLLPRQAISLALENQSRLERVAAERRERALTQRKAK